MQDYSLDENRRRIRALITAAMHEKTETFSDAPADLVVTFDGLHAMAGPRVLTFQRHLNDWFMKRDPMAPLPEITGVERLPRGSGNISHTEISFHVDADNDLRRGQVMRALTWAEGDDFFDQISLSRITLRGVPIYTRRPDAVTPAAAIQTPHPAG